MLTKETIIDQITADAHGNILWRENTRILEDGEVLSEKYYRSSLAPGASLDGVPEQVAKVAQATWTPELVSAFTASELAKHAEERAKIEAAIAEIDAKKEELEAKQAKASNV